MTWTLKAATAAAAATTPAINCTGADLIIAEVSSFAAGTFSDSFSNTWQQIGPFTSGGVITSLYYCLGPAVSAAQTFSFSGSFCSINVTAWSGSQGSGGSVDQTAHVTGAAVVTLAAGSITPSVGNSLIIAGLGTDGGTAQTISVGTIQENTPFTGGLNEGGAIASFVQGAAAPINPAWSWTTAANAVAIVASFPPNNRSTIADYRNGFNVQNVSATTGPFSLLGGKYAISCLATFGGGSVTFQALGPDGITYIGTVAAFSANGFATVDLPSGLYQVGVTTATSVYLSCIPISPRR